MKKSISAIIIFARATVSASAIAVLIWLTACAAIHEPEQDCPDNNANTQSVVAIEFQVHTTAEMLGTRSSISRADIYHDEETSDNAQIEDYICPSDFGVFIFAKGTDSATDPILLYYNTSTGESEGDFSMTGSIGDYTISLMLPSSLVEYVFGSTGSFAPLSPSGTRTMKLTVAMLANIGGSSQTHSDYSQFRGLKAALGTENFDNASRLSDFTRIAGDLQYAASVSPTQIHIPMYGLSTFTLKESDMYNSRPDQRLQLGNISMLRAMMKVRVSDNIVTKNVDGYPKVTSATLNYRSVSGYVTPENPGNYSNGNQVHTDRVIEPVEGTGPNTLNMRVGTVGDNSFVGCAPPQSINSNAPSLAIYVQRDAESAPQRFDVDITPERFPDITGPGMWGDTMLRNHVYTLSVTGIELGGQLSISATVDEWEDSEFNFDFSNDVGAIPEIGKIDWTEGSYASIVDETTLIMNPWHDGKSVPAECTFGLATPVGALWTATLIVEEGASDAFYFVTEETGDDSHPTTVEGRIDGKTASLRIATSNDAPAQNNRVSLQIVVVTQGGAAYTVATDGKILLKWSLVQNMQ